MAIRRRASRRAPQSVRITAGPWKGVQTTGDPFDDTTDVLVDATNLYFPDPQGSCGAYARPGFSLLTPTPFAGTPPFRGQGLFAHVDLNGTITNFIVVAGKLYRPDATFQVWTDVTPIGATISTLASARVFGVQFGNDLIVSDGVNRPWVMTNFTSTPVTATEIHFNAANEAWSAYGKPTVFGGSIFFILNEVAGVYARGTLAWSAPADPLTGYQQTDYDYVWSIYATGVAAITAIQGTNTALYYGTNSTISEIVGPVGPNLSTSSTTASISVNVGMAIPSTVVLFGATIFFCDFQGRPWMLPLGGTPQPIYLQMRQIVETTTGAGFPIITQRVASATFEPTFNLYLVAIYSCQSASEGPPVEMYAFDARSGIYVGRWSIGAGAQLEALGTFIDLNGRAYVGVLGSKDAPVSPTLAASGYVWALNGLTSEGDFLTTEDGVPLCLEVDPPTPPGTLIGTYVTSEGSPALWYDNGAVPTISVSSSRLGYSTTDLLNVDRAQIVVGSQSPVTVTMSTASVSATVQATPTPVTSPDTNYRAVAGADIMGRGVIVTVSPTTSAVQWAVQQIVIDATASVAGPEES